MTTPLGTFTKLDELSDIEREIVKLAWQGANNSADFGLSPQSNFPVGAGILAANADGETRHFFGSNVENSSFAAAICAERSAAMTAASVGYTNFHLVSVLCRKYPGGSPCGLCRQVLIQFGQNATLLNVIDHDSNVRRAMVSELLPAARTTAAPFASLDEDTKGLVRRILSLKSRSHVPYSNRARAALLIASDIKGRERAFRGVSDDNASYGGSAIAETVAMRTARTEGHTLNVRLMVTVEDATAANPVDGESLQVLREFGADAPIFLVGEDRSVVTSSLDELLPDSFGPESL